MQCGVRVRVRQISHRWRHALGMQGLAVELAEIEALVVSSETAKGAPPINEDRLQRGFPPLQVMQLPHNPQLLIKPSQESSL